MAAVVQAATVKDTDGHVIDTGELFGKRRADEADEAEGVDEVETAAADEAAGEA
ncbi:hypothetical protein MHEC_17360 [Mycobacterium heckeshornense]|uniref:Uncharacterized protein n=1 Tax=Mycobacterium heckeshornense TaxID=110505 RepID=A0A7R7GSN2_9MYCO|nr:hypothetical protein MHEC_17360 [Mycobacterium heckeshornense]